MVKIKQVQYLNQPLLVSTIFPHPNLLLIIQPTKSENDRPKMSFILSANRSKVEKSQIEGNGEYIEILFDVEKNMNLVKTCIFP
ncbi:hypothetical protein LI951_03215 [Enterococcus sp. BWT-B8]|uniref:hypothetical protein n=1 Tax=Enterococcus sp. BWT-B8 TaxID=2885157 RepID=UPI001E5541E1|nr:hypothetical protein [Enterococcus sp. BWT-B8]MCB5951069.1 hypothetical protein [Enterococcus sp. BWT-B8]